jgi:crossover junction endodeoxyribonuclease RuvC
MIILGVDPGFERCGVAVIDSSKGIGGEVMLFSTSIRTSAKESFPQRLLTIGNEISEIMKKFSPDVLAIETLYFSANTKTAMNVAEARGVIVFESIKGGAEIFEYTPSQIKIAMTGEGRADKKQVEFMVRKLVTFPKEEVLDDELDAVAIALTHSACHRAVL